MKRAAISLLIINALLLVLSLETCAQTKETRKFEVEGHFSSLSIAGGGTRTEVGFGGRFTFNVSDTFALEAEGNFFPRQDGFRALRTAGRTVEGLYGVKVGRRYNRFGIFGKARTGYISFSEGLIEIIPSTPTFTTNTVFNLRTQRLTHAASDIGGVLELYVSHRVFTRFDFGDTIIRYGRTSFTTFSAVPGGAFTPVQGTIPSDTTHNFQFNAGVGFRF